MDLSGLNTTILVLVGGALFLWWIFANANKSGPQNNSNSSNPSPLPQKDQEYLQEKQAREEEYKRQKQETEFNEIIHKYQKYIDKFCEIAHREVSTLDEWGDENMDSLRQLKKDCIFRIARSIYKDEYTQNKTQVERYINGWFENYLGENDIEIDSSAPYWARKLFNEYLPKVFDDYHHAKKNSTPAPSQDFNKMTGVDFENYIGSVLVGLGYSVSGTPKTGDKGADLIATKDNRMYTIQVKRYSGTVGNGAIQEVVAAKNYYNGDVAVVITNSTFTPSAKELAKKNNVVLIDKNGITHIDLFLETYNFYCNTNG